MLLGACLVSRYKKITKQSVTKNPADELCQRRTISPLKGDRKVL